MQVVESLGHVLAALVLVGQEALQLGPQLADLNKKKKKRYTGIARSFYRLDGRIAGKYCRQVFALLTWDSHLSFLYECCLQQFL